MDTRSTDDIGRGDSELRVLIAGMGNVLRRDDGFGVEAVKRLADANTLPGDVKVIEVGIGGIHLVQELMSGYDAVVIVDALEQGSAPGTVHILEATVPDLADWPEEKRQNFLADMHYTTPSKALILARALDILPPKTYIVGCQPADADDLGIGLSEPVQDGVERTLEQLGVLIHELRRSGGG